MTHDLKILPNFFEPVVDGTKTFEVRRFDRDFSVGDELILREWLGTKTPQWKDGYSGRQVVRKITYILSVQRATMGDIDGENYVILGIQPIHGKENDEPPAAKPAWGIRKIIKALESLVEDRRSFFHDETKAGYDPDDDGIFRHDAEALEQAIAVLDGLYRFANEGGYLRVTDVPEKEV